MLLSICHEANLTKKTKSTSRNKSTALAEALANKYIRNETAGQLFLQQSYLWDLIVQSY